MRSFVSHLVSGVVGGVIVIVFIWLVYTPHQQDNIFDGGGTIPGNSFGKSINYSEAEDSLNNIFSVGFGEAASQSLKPVVHIRALGLDSDQPDYLEDGFWGNAYPGRLQASSGSGVIVSPDGYIVTNNHVVADASEITISIYNKRTYKAKVVGLDPSTDLALLKIEEKDLPAAVLANSDFANVGDWVLAVGNPFNLASTVTAGIISAKARNIHILRDNMAVESFIQTDAAVNPGNSGGALVNLKGELIGINTAIATPTGTYAGYSFAVPSNIVRRVVNDLKEYGEVQRGYLGVVIRDLDWRLSQKLGLEISEGVLVDKLISNGAAKRAGMKSGDVILQINKRKIRTTTELVEIVASHGHGDIVQVTIHRDGKQKKLDVKLLKSSPLSLK